MRREEKTEELKGLERLKGRGDREDTRTVYGHWGRGKKRRWEKGREAEGRKNKGEEREGGETRREKRGKKERPGGETRRDREGRMRRAGHLMPGIQRVRCSTTPSSTKDLLTTANISFVL